MGTVKQASILCSEDLWEKGGTWNPHYLCNLLRKAVHTTLQNFDDLLMVGRIFSKTNLQLPEELPAFFKCLLLFKLIKKKKIHFSHLKMYFQVSLVGLNELLQYLSSFAICFPFVRIHTAKLGRGGRWEINSTLYINTSIRCKILFQPFLHTTPCTKDKKIQKECNERKPVS